MTNIILIETKEHEGDKLYKYAAGRYQVRKVDHACGYTSIEVIPTDRSDRYLPEIYARSNIEDNAPYAFEVQTTSYGALPTEELQKVIANLQEASEIAQALTKMFVK